MKRTPIKRKPKTKEKREEEAKESKRMAFFFLYCWNALPRESEISKSKFSDINRGNYHHCFEKSTHPELAFSISNILRVTLDEHHNLNSDPEYYEEAKNKRKFVNQNYQKCLEENNEWISYYEKYIK
jgi:hypothetical protein